MQPGGVPRRRKPREWAAIVGFLLPNFLGFLIFTLFPIALSLVMAFTNWSLKPAIETHWVGLQNFTDLLGVHASADGHDGLGAAYIAAAVLALLGLVGVMWGATSGWRGTRTGGVVLAALGGGMVLQLIAAAVYARATGAALSLAMPALGVEFAFGGAEGIAIAGLAFLVAGLAAAWREDGDWRFGWGAVPALVLAAAVLSLWTLNRPMWQSHEPNDYRLWDYFYNTIYLMLGLPFTILGSLALAMLLNDELPLGRWRQRLAGTALCVLLGLLTLVIVWGLGYPNLGLLGGVFWAVAALGMAFNIVSFRTIFYLPMFTSGVALMVLWKALYNPKTGPINVGLDSLYTWLGVGPETIQAILPQWLASIAWAKPALIIMGIWTAIGGTNMLLYLAGLANVSQELIDAAHVDGAGRWARFRHVVWPQLAPTTFFICIMGVIGGLQGGFEAARVMTSGGPAGSTTTLSYYVYNKFFNELDLGYAAAISWILFALIFVATMINWRFGKKIEVV